MTRLLVSVGMMSLLSWGCGAGSDPDEFTRHAPVVEPTDAGARLFPDLGDERLWTPEVPIPRPIPPRPPGDRFDFER